MGKRRRIEIISFSERTVVIRRQVAPTAAWCDLCLAESRMITPDEAARVARVTPREIYQWVEARRVHFIEEPEGTLLLCLGSLAANMETA